MDDEKLQARDLLRTDFVSVSLDTSVDRALEKFGEHDTVEDRPSIYYVYIEDDGKLEGIASVKELMNSESLEAAMDQDMVTVGLDEDMEDVARVMAEYDYRAIPVVEKGRLEGILRLDDMVEVLDEEATEDIFKKAGVIGSKEFYRSEKMLNASIRETVVARLPWLVFALAGGIIAGTVIEAFEHELQALVVLAFFIPVIMDMGGNVGTQSSTIFVRGLALGSIEEGNIWRRVFREALVGGIIGLIVGVLAGAVIYFWQGIGIASVISISLFLTCTVASVIGTLIPGMVDRTGYDPAAVSDPMVTTIKDITALLIYFGVATLLLGL